MTVTGQDDDQVDGNVPYSVILAAAASADTNYNGLDPADVAVTNLDNDTAGVTVSTISGDTDEYGTTATFTVVLDSQPSADVTIDISSKDATEGTVSPAPPLTLTFTDANWNLPQTVTVTGRTTIRSTAMSPTRSSSPRPPAPIPTTTASTRPMSRSPTSIMIRPG